MSTQPKQEKAKRAAVIHSGGMRTEAKKTRVVFKNVLDTPFSTPWPEVTSENNALVLDMLCDLVRPIREYQCSRSPKHLQGTTSNIKKASRKTLTGTNNVDTQQKPNPALAIANHDPSAKVSTTSLLRSNSATAQTSAESTSISSASSSLPPAILELTVVGINAVTRTLERSIKNCGSHPVPSAVFLCKGDLAPSHLYSHLGPMIAMLPGVILFPLLKGSEKRLSEALGMDAAGAVAINYGSKEAEDLVMVLGRMVERVTVPWLPKISTPVASSGLEARATSTVSWASGSAASVTPSTAADQKSTVSWIPTNIKAIKTTIPIVVRQPKAAVPADGKGKSQQPQTSSRKHASDNAELDRGKAKGKKAKTD